MRSRWHDPALGTWLTRDPAGYADGMCLYRYVKGNPLVYFDPFGMQAEGAPVGSQKQLEEELGIPRGTGRADNRGAWSDEGKRRQQEYYDELAAEVGARGREFLAAAAAAGLAAGMMLTPGPDEVILGVLIERLGLLIRGGKIIDRAGKVVHPSQIRRVVEQERRAMAAGKGPDAYKGAAAKTKRSLRDRMGEPPAGMKKPQAHHDLPRKHRDKFEKKGFDIDDPENGRWVEGGPEGGHQKWSKEFEREWDEFFEQNQDPSPDMIRKKRDELRKDPRFQANADLLHCQP